MDTKSSERKAVPDDKNNWHIVGGVIYYGRVSEYKEFQADHDSRPVWLKTRKGIPWGKGAILS